jgi:imidazolonepropionase-like amidohydrolase
VGAGYAIDGRQSAGRNRPYDAAMRAMISAVILLWGAALSTASPAAESRQPVALVNVNVIDTLEGSVDRGVTVLIEGTRITRISRPSDRAPLPVGTRRIALDGKFVIPGLWDMHVHSALDERDPEWFFPLLIANGVTGVRDMGTFVSLAKMRQLRDEVRAGRRLGPRMVLAGTIIDGLGAVERGPERHVPSFDDMVRAVRHLKQQGADFVKVDPLLERDAYFAAVAEARRQQLPIAGQVPEPVTVEDAANAGHRSVEHLDKLVLGCSNAEAAIVDIKEEVLRGMRVRPNEDLLQQLTPTPEEAWETIRSLDLERCDALMKTLAKNRTAIVPTLIAAETFGPRARARNDPRLLYLPRSIREGWLAMSAEMMLRSAEQNELMAAMEDLERRLVRPLQRAGAPLLAGTHAAAITPYVFPGFSLHDELTALVGAGLAPLEALQAATLNPARFLNEEANLGTVAAGRLADLVVLDANPLEDIRDLRGVRAVVLDGRVLDRDELDALLRSAADFGR